MDKLINISALQPGMVIVKITEQNGPVRIRKSGLVTSEAMVQGLAEMGVMQVQIDPEQTVQLEPEVAPMGAAVTSSPEQSSSVSQVLLQSSRVQSVVSQAQQSEQFNRSLFLPSAQHIPSAWHYQGKQAAVAAAVLLLGVALGWGGAQVPHWLEQLGATPAEVASRPSDTSTVTSPAATTETTTLTQVPPAESPASEVVSPTNPTLGPTPGPIPNTQEQTQVPQQPQEAAVPSEEPEGVRVNGPQNSNVDDISPELLKRFQQAVADLDNSDPAQAEPVVPTSDDLGVVRVDQLPSWVMASLPEMDFSTHIFATEPTDRWVRVNGKELGEGDWINDELRISRIEQHHIILNFKGHEFSMRALADW